MPKKDLRRKLNPGSRNENVLYAWAVKERIEALRRARGLSQEEAAYRAGMPVGAWSQIEKGERWLVRFYDLACLAKALDCKVTDIIDVHDIGGPRDG